ncbi:hypothetical protein [Pseudomonas sp. 2835]|uniref:hypothetical protein n=1 Tax=Pseudomonas sp. 2835 TaxID=3156451 RepID=UPI003D1C656C
MKPRALLTIGSTLALACLPLFAQAQATVAQVFNGEMLGTNLKYFESVAGIARTSFGDTHTYKVQGCEITADAAGGSINDLRLELSPTCKADLSSFIGSFAPAANKPLTIAALHESTGGPLEFYADCLEMCGNAADPSVYALWEGPHAVGFTQVLAEVMLTDDAAIAASSKWADEMKKHKGEDFVMESKYNCERSFDPVALQSFKSVAITAVTIGTQLSKPGC